MLTNAAIVGKRLVLVEQLSLQSLITYQTCFFLIDLGGYSSKLSQEFQDLICAVMEGVGKPNVADYFPALRLVDPQGARRRMMIDYGKLIEIFYSIINERVQLRASSEGSKASNDVLGYFLNLVEEDNSEISYNDFKHFFSSN
jgi:hypothetical protein